MRERFWDVTGMFGELSCYKCTWRGSAVLCKPQHMSKLCGADMCRGEKQLPYHEVG